MMILEIVGVGLLISACLAILLDEAIYSVAALAGTFLFTSALFALDGAIFAAIFQFAIGVGTVAILFLEGESLSERHVGKVKLSTPIIAVVVGIALSLPAIFFTISSPNNVSVETGFAAALWDLRAVDVVLQGLVILTLAIGIAIVLHERKIKKVKSKGEP
jgi:NADH:ubiquinone oxidoreductase subunit 6 (subunit J)